MQKALLLAFVCLAVIYSVSASSHSEAPGTASIPNADITDLYAFRSYQPGRSAYVTFLINVQPLQSPYGGPNYFSLSDDHFYELYIDNGNDGNEDFTFQWIYGNSLGTSTPLGRPFLYFDDNACSPIANPDSIQPVQPNNPVYTGLAIPVGSGNFTATVGIALKVGGFILNDTVRQTIDPRPGSMGALNWYEYYSLNLLKGDRANPTSTTPIANTNGATSFEKPFDYAGQFTFGMPGTYEAYAMSKIQTLNLGGGLFGTSCGSTTDGKVWVGQRAEPFYISLGRIFDFLNMIPITAAPFASLAIANCYTNNDLREKNVDTFALEVPIACLGGNGIINVWAATRRLFHADNDTNGVTHIPGVQVSRMGNPLVNELVIGLIDKGRFNRQTPRLDADPNFGFGTYVLYPTIPEVVSIRYLAAVNAVLGTSLTSLAPATPRNDLLTVFLTGIPGVNKGTGNFVGEVMRLNLNIPATAKGQQNNLGIVGALSTGGTDLAGYPNGRRPGDDAVDISLLAVMGVLCTQPVANFSGQYYGICSQLGDRNLTVAQGAPIGGVPLSDGSPIRDMDFQDGFPYFNTPTPGSYLDVAPNVVTDATKCYPAAQHGRCPICPSSNNNNSTGGDGGSVDCGSASGLTSFLSLFI